jgi:phage FluMu gp28-like protein
VSKRDAYFLPYQRRWIEDESGLKIMEKSRQIGISYSTAYSAVRRCAPKDARLDVWVSSRDDTQAKLFLQDCMAWANVLQIACEDLGEVVIDRANGSTAHALRIGRDRNIWSLSSNPNALAGKRGHVILDEFALHQDQRLLYRIAKPVTTWGGQLEIISTHRGSGSVFNEIIRGIRENGNPMGWSHHRITLQDAVEQGLVEKINAKKRAEERETRAAFIARLRRECLDEEQWLQEYCCQPTDDATAFITWEMITEAEGDGKAMNPSDFADPKRELYLGMDVGRKQDLTVIDIGELVGDVCHDRARIELRNKTFAEQEHELGRWLGLPAMRRGCLDATGLGMQLAERARERYGWKVEPVTFTAAAKEQMAFGLRRQFEDRRLRIFRNPALRADLRGIKKETTAANNIRFVGDAEDSHCDRFWALALREHAHARPAGAAAVFMD